MNTERQMTAEQELGWTLNGLRPTLGGLVVDILFKLKDKVFEEKTANLRQEIAELKSALDDCGSSGEFGANKIEELKAENDRLKKTISSYSSQVCDLQDEQENLSNENYGIMVENQKLRESLERIIVESEDNEQVDWMYVAENMVDIAKEALKGGEQERCHAHRDGDCDWINCPQIRDNEPNTSGRHCPLDVDTEDDW